MAARTEQKAKITCSKCGAEYKKLPAYACPRCGTPLCASGCDGCIAKCARRKP